MHKNLPQITFTIPSLPLWKGVVSTPVVEVFPFDLCWDYTGFIRQTTELEILEEIYTGYSKEDYKFISPPPGSSDWGNALAKFYLDEFLTHIDDLDNKHILEIGAGTTGFARLLMERFNIASYTIIDPSIHENVDDIRIIRKFFPCNDELTQSYDLVISLNTVEHVADVSLFLRSVKKLLRNKNGESKAFISLPDAGSQLSAGDLSVLLHEHINYFSVDSFEQYIANNGLVTHSLTVKNDSIFACLASKQSTKIIEHVNIPISSTFLEGISKMTQVLLNFGKYLKDFAERRSIIFHGATPGLNSFLFLTKLGNCPAVIITDGDEEKHGKFLPTHNVAIVSPSATLYQGADLVIISAPSFYKPIESHIRGLISKSTPIIPLSFEGLTILQDL